MRATEPPNRRTSGNGAITLLFHTERSERAVPDSPLKNPASCRSRRKEAQITSGNQRDQSLLTSAPTSSTGC